MPWRLPSPVSRAVAFRYGAGAILAGGLGAGDRSTDRVLMLDLHKGVVGRTGPLATATHDAGGALLDGRPVVVGGGAASELSVVQRLDRHGLWHVVGRLPAPRSDLNVQSTIRGLLVVGGYDGVRLPLSLLASQDGSHFHRVGHLPTGIRYAGATQLGDAVWVLGGEANSRELDEVLRIDLRTGLVRSFGRMPTPLGHEAVVAAGQRLLVIGGRPTPATATGAMWWFDTEHRSWERAGRLPYPVADAPAVRERDGVFLLGGETPAFTAKVTRVTLR
jgi:hypothetical protein